VTVDELRQHRLVSTYIVVDTLALNVSVIGERVEGILHYTVLDVCAYCLWKSFADQWVPHLRDLLLHRATSS